MSLLDVEWKESKKEEIKTIPLYLWTKKRNPECVICLKTLRSDDWIAKLSCDHPTCGTCVNKHMDYNGTSCGYCMTPYINDWRDNVRTIDIITIFD